MSPQSGAVRQPTNDLSAFDISKRSPEQIALLFARWKEQRKRLQRASAPAEAPKSKTARFMPAIVRAHAHEEAAVAPPASEPLAIRYSAPFAAILAAGGDEGFMQRIQRIRNPDLGPAALGIPRGTRRRSRLRWALAGAVSVVAVAAASGAALWQQAAPTRIAWTQAPPGDSAAPVASPGANAAPAEPIAASVAASATEFPLEIQTASRLVPVATLPPVPAAWPLQQMVDSALTQPTQPVADVAPAPLTPKLKPRPPKVQTASKTIAAPKPAPIGSLESEVEPKIVTSAPAPNVDEIAPSTASASAAVPTETEDGATKDAGPAILSRGGNDKASYSSRTTGQVSATAGTAHGPTGSDGSADPGAGSGSGGGGSGGAGDPGGDPGGGTGGSGDGGGSGTGGDTGGGDSGSGGSGDNGSGGGGDSGGGDSGDGDSGEGESGEGESGGGLGGAVGGLGGALGGLGGDGNGSGKDKDKD